MTKFSDQILDNLYAKSLNLVTRSVRICVQKSPNLFTFSTFRVLGAGIAAVAATAVEKGFAGNIKSVEN